MAMSRRHENIESLLRCLQDSVKAHETNAYQIAKATGLPLRSVQNLLRQIRNPTLSNVEVILTGLGLQLYVRADRKPTIRPARRGRDLPRAG